MPVLQLTLECYQAVSIATYNIKAQCVEGVGQCVLHVWSILPKRMRMWFRFVISVVCV